MSIHVGGNTHFCSYVCEGHNLYAMITIISIVRSRPKNDVLYFQYVRIMNTFSIILLDFVIGDHFLVCLFLFFSVILSSQNYTVRYIPVLILHVYYSRQSVIFTHRYYDGMVPYCILLKWKMFSACYFLL